MLRDMKDSEFVAYLNQVADDYEESGSEATAEDYREAARRIEETQYLEQEAYSMGQLDLVNSGEYVRVKS